jgi:hypothetical protein
MKVNLTLLQLERIIESLKETKANRSDDNLINYLIWMKKDAGLPSAQELDDIPF